jgi:hypothetical protein
MNLKTEEQFEYWLADMDDALDRFFKLLPDNVRARLDFSVASLDVLEAWILEKFHDNQEMLQPDAAIILDGLARYIGETFRKAIGGRWEIRLDDPNYVFHRLPQLTGFSERSTPESPISLATAAASRRTGNYLRTILENMKKRYGGQQG